MLSVFGLCAFKRRNTEIHLSDPTWYIQVRFGMVMNYLGKTFGKKYKNFIILRG